MVCDITTKLLQPASKKNFLNAHKRIVKKVSGITWLYHIILVRNKTFQSEGLRQLYIKKKQMDAIHYTIAEPHLSNQWIYIPTCPTTVTFLAIKQELCLYFNNFMSKLCFYHVASIVMYFSYYINYCAFFSICVQLMKTFGSKHLVSYQ